MGPLEAANRAAIAAGEAEGRRIAAAAYLRHQPDPNPMPIFIIWRCPEAFGAAARMTVGLLGFALAAFGPFVVLALGPYWLLWQWSETAAVVYLLPAMIFTLVLGVGLATSVVERIDQWA